MPTLVREQSPLSALPPRVPRPRSLAVGQWAASRLDAGDFGPSMLELVLWFPVDERQTMDALVAALGPSDGEHEVTVDRRALAAAAPALAVAGEADTATLTGARYAAASFESTQFFGARVVGLATGVIVAVRTGG